MYITVIELEFPGKIPVYCLCTVIYMAVLRANREGGIIIGRWVCSGGPKVVVVHTFAGACFPRGSNVCDCGKRLKLPIPTPGPCLRLEKRVFLLFSILYALTTYF